MLFDAGTGECQNFCGKNNYPRQFCPKILLVFLLEKNRDYKKVNLLFDRHQMLLVSRLWKLKISMVRVAVKMKLID